MSEQIVKHEPQGLMVSAVKPMQVLAVIKHVHEIIKDAMVEGKPDAEGKWNGDGDYAVLPGTAKKTLLKPGAEKLLLSFGLVGVPRDPKIRDLGNGHREIIIETEILEVDSRRLHAIGIGSCSTMESKYRYRNVSDFEDIGTDIPKDAKEKKQDYRKKGFGMKKIEGSWHWVKYGDERREENPDIADVYNTVLKMAAKRSFVSGAIQATASSGMFTVDIEEQYVVQSIQQPERQPQAPATAHAAPVNAEIVEDISKAQRMVEQMKVNAEKREQEASSKYELDGNGVPRCPACGNTMWDNRGKISKSGKKGPDFSCKNKECKKQPNAAGAYVVDSEYTTCIWAL